MINITSNSNFLGTLATTSQELKHIVVKCSEKRLKSKTFNQGWKMEMEVSTSYFKCVAFSINLSSPYILLHINYYNVLVIMVGTAINHKTIFEVAKNKLEHINSVPWPTTPPLCFHLLFSSIKSPLKLFSIDC